MTRWAWTAPKGGWPRFSPCGAARIVDESTTPGRCARCGTEVDPQ